MNCTPLGREARMQLNDTINRLTELIAMQGEAFVRDGELNLEQLGMIIRNATELGKLSAIRDHDDLAIRDTLARNGGRRKR